MPDPISNGYASNIPPPDVENPGTYSQWETAFLALINQLVEEAKTGKAQEAFEKIPEVMSMGSDYRTDYENVVASDKLSVRSTIQSYVNAIQKDYDQYSTGSGSDTSYAQDAIYAYKQIQALESQYPDEVSDVKSDLDLQLSTIFGSTDPNSIDPGTLAGTWATQWTLPSDSSTSGWSGTSDVNNAFNDIGSNLTSLSSPINAMIESNMKEASTYMESETNAYKTIISMIQAPVTASKNAAS